MRQKIEARAVKYETAKGPGGEKVGSLLGKLRSGRKKKMGHVKLGS